MKPLILTYSTPRKGVDDCIAYEYDFKQSLNIISIGGEKKAFINAASNDLSAITQTRVVKEQTDIGLDYLELKTKTEASRERDDHHHSLLEMNTKTLTSRERDDQSSDNL